MDNLSHRKSELTLLIKDKEGNPITDAKVSYKLSNHQFLFGIGGFDVMNHVLCSHHDRIKIPDVEMDAETKKQFEKMFMAKEAVFKERTDMALEIFNYMTLPFYWGNFEKVEGKPFTEGLMATAEFLKDRNVKIKGHPLCWHTVCADWLLKYDDETILKKQIERIIREVSDFKGVIDMWDVINEVVIMPIFDKYDNAVTRICNKYGQVGLVKRVFDAARETNPNATLLLNDFNTTPQYEDLIERCLDAGVDISVIGIQSHQHQGYWGKDKLYDVLERFSRFKLPIHFTENTFVSGSLIPKHIEDLNDWVVTDWPSTPEGEIRQKEQMEEMYRILFANPNVQGITGWDLADGAWLNAPSGIIRCDNSKKPSYDMLKKLIKEEYSTKGELKTDENGVVKISGFKGEYDIEINGKTIKAVLGDKESKEVISL